MTDGHIWKRAMVNFRNNSDGSGYSPNTPLEQDPYIYVGAGATEEDTSQVNGVNEHGIDAPSFTPTSFVGFLLCRTVRIIGCQYETVRSHLSRSQLHVQH